MKRVTALLIGLCLLPVSAGAQVIEYYHLDAVGNVRAVTDQQGRIIERHDYLPFGEEWNPQGGTQPLRFTGKERDAETGLDYFGARYYGSKIGRFTTVDPVYTWQANLENPQRWNRYAYALNNPLRNVDPDGKVAIPVIIAGIWAAYEIGSQIYDAYTAYQTVTNPSATTGEKAAAVGGFAIGAIAPGGGYGTAGKKVLGKLDDLADAKGIVSRADDATDATGLVYRRTDPETGVAYMGRSKSEETFLKRQGAHDRNMGTKHDYEVVDRATPGAPLRVAEESAIRAGGGPGRLANKRYEMNDAAYKACGGTCEKPK